MAMPWTRAKALIKWHRESPERIKDLNALFDACFRIQLEASRAAGRYIPMVVENVKGAQPWVGRAKAHYGSYFLWGDVEMHGDKILIPGVWDEWMKTPKRLLKQSGRNFHFPEKYGIPSPSFQGAGHEASVQNAEGLKLPDNENDGGSWFGVAHTRHLPNQRESNGVKQGGEWWHDPDSMTRRFSSKSDSRKAASAQIARIPLPLSRFIGKGYYPNEST
jgi:hypothetical protein